MFSYTILASTVLNGLMAGAVYALIALGLTLIYGVLHIVNFAHGALLTAAMFAAFFAHKLLGLDPYLSAFFLTPLFFVLGYGLQRFIIGPAAHGEDRNVLLVTLGLGQTDLNLVRMGRPQLHPLVPELLEPPEYRGEVPILGNVVGDDPKLRHTHPAFF